MQLSVLAFVPSSPSATSLTTPPPPRHQQQIFLGPLGVLIGILLATRTAKLQEHLLSFLQLCTTALGTAEPVFDTRLFLPASSSKLTAQLRTQPKGLEAPRPDPPAKPRARARSCCFCPRFCNTPGGQALTSRVRMITTCAGASRCRQTMTLAGRPGLHGLRGTESRNRLFRPQDSSLWVFSFQFQPKTRIK